VAVATNSHADGFVDPLDFWVDRTGIPLLWLESETIFLKESASSGLLLVVATLGTTRIGGGGDGGCSGLSRARRGGYRSPGRRGGCRRHSSWCRPCGARRRRLGGHCSKMFY
jgi:hypothetical protein